MKLPAPRLLASSILVMIAACKPPASSQSGLQTLENFALNEEVRTNVCSAPEAELDKRDPRKKVAAFIEVKDTRLAQAMSAELILALSAVPDAAFKIFQARNGKILITPDAARFCSFSGAVKFSGKTPIFKSCLVNIPKGSGTTKFTKSFEGMTLVSIPDRQAVRHGIVRTMGYMVADTLAKDSGFEVLRAELTKSFLVDVARSSIFSLTDQENLLGKGIDTIVRTNIKNKEKNILKDVKATDQAISNFMNFVVGEAFDSYYCKTGPGSSFEKSVADRIKTKADAPLFEYLTDTRAVMDHFFPRTHQVFLLVDAHMRGFASKLPNITYRYGIFTDTIKLTASSEQSEGYSLAGTTVADRKAQLEAQIREQATNTREAHEQWQHKKATHDGAWSDVWGSKKSEMDTAKAVYNFTQGREQALQKELQAVLAEEKKVGATAQTANNTQFQKVDEKVATFDANAALKQGVQDTAKVYGQATSTGLGYVGEKAGGLISEDAAAIAKAAGQGVGDGVGGVLGSFGTIATDSIEGVQKKVEDTTQFANNLAVDPSGTLTKAAQDKLNETQQTIVNIGSNTGKILTGDTAALSSTLRNAPVLGNAYATAENTVKAGHALYTGGSMDAIVKDQYDVAAKSIEAAGSEAFNAFNPVSMAQDKLADMQKKAVVGGMVHVQKEMILDIHTSPSLLHTEYLRNAAKTYNTVGEIKENFGHVTEALNFEANKNANPAQSLDTLQSTTPGHQYNPMPAAPPVRPAVDTFNQAMLASPPVAIQPMPAAPAPAAAAPAPVQGPAPSSDFDL